MGTIANLAINITGHIGGLKSALGEAQSTLSDVGGKIRQIGDNIRQAGQGMTAAVTLPILGVATASVKMASDLSESSNKVDVIFGKSAAAVKAWAESSATALGVSKQEAYEALGTFGNLFKSVGMNQDTTTKMSENLVQLASDLASFNNLDPTEVLLKLRSGLVGEAEPLRSLGVNLSETAVKQQALAMGLAATEKALTPAMLMQARYVLIMKATKDAQGDFARTSDGLANSQRIITASIKDAGAALGTVLLPYVGMGATKIKELVEAFNGLSDGTKRWIVFGALAVAAIGPLLIGVGALVSAFSLLLGPIGLVVAAMALLSVAWANDWGGIQEKTQAVIDFLRPGFMELMSWIDAATQGNFGPLKEGLQGALQSINATIQAFKWSDFIAKLDSWAAYITPIVWSEIVVALSDWGAYITGLDWTKIITTVIDWATWIPALSWAAVITLLKWETYIAAFVWSEWLSKLDWSGTVSHLTWSDFINVLSWAGYIAAFAWDSFITKLEWLGVVDKVSWAAFVEKLTWSSFVTALSDWGQWIVSLDWTKIITTAIDWATWIPALSWTAFVFALEWGAYLVSLVWSEWLSKLDWSGTVSHLTWSDFINVLSWAGYIAAFAWDSFITKLEWTGAIDKVSWDAFIAKLTWSSFVTALSNWGAYIKALDWATIITTAINWATFVGKLEWSGFVAVLGWATWIGKLAWSEFVTALSWAGWVSALSWSSFVPTISWGSFISALDLRAYIPAFPGWSSLISAVGLGNNAGGTGSWKGGPTWVGEQGTEAIQLPTGKWLMAGVGGPQLMDLPAGTKIFKHEDTLRMMNGGMMAIGQNAGGTTPLSTTDVPRAGSYQPLFNQEINTPLREMTRAVKENTKAQKESITDLKSALQNTSGLFHTSEVTQKQLDLAKLGIPQNFADDWVRHLTDNVLNGAHWKDADIKDAALRAGIDPMLPAKVILDMVKDKWNDSSLFAGGKNLDLINQDAVKKQLADQAAAKSGQQSIMALFGIQPDQVAGQAAALGGQLRLGIDQGLAGAPGGLGTGIIGNLSAGITVKTMQPVATKIMSGVASSLSAPQDNDKQTVDFGGALVAMVNAQLDKKGLFDQTGQLILTNIANGWGDGAQKIDVIGKLASVADKQLLDQNVIDSLKNVGAHMVKIVFAGFDEEASGQNWTGAVKVGKTGSSTAGNALGTSYSSGGMRWVGETGRELMYVPRGAGIMANPQAEAMAAGGGVTVNMPGAVIRDERDVVQLAYDVADIIERRSRR